MANFGSGSNFHNYYNLKFYLIPLNKSYFIFNVFKGIKIKGILFLIWLI